MQKYQPIYLCLFVFLVSCTSINKEKRPQEIENITISPSKTFDRVDTIPFGQFSSITAQENFLMAAEYKKFRVLVTDTNLTLKHILGREGQGTGEFASAQHHIIRNNKIYIGDLGNTRINVFNILDGGFIKSIKLPNKPILPTAQFYLDDYENIYYATQPYANGKMLIKLDSNGKLIKRFGENFQKTNNVSEDVNVSCREMVVHRDRIIVVGQTFGIVEIYDLEGNKVNTFDISSYEPIKTNSILVKKELKERPNTTFNLHTSCYVRNDKLYICPSDLKPNVINAKDILVFKWSNTSCELFKTISFKTNKLDEKTLYSPIFVTEDEKTIYAQGLMTKNLYVFKMP